MPGIEMSSNTRSKARLPISSTACRPSPASTSV